MNRSSAGGIALSSLPSKYQDGSVFHAGEADGVAAKRRRRTAAAPPITAAVSAIDIGGEGFIERIGGEIEVDALAPVGLVNGTGLTKAHRLPSILEKLLLAPPTSPSQPLR